MAGLFQVLYGTKDGTFQKAQVLNGTDGEPLIMPGGKQVTDAICTRPFACDLDGDGNLDIVSGNFSGTFGVFKGEGDGNFATESTWLKVGSEKLKVAMHSDPFLIDWDADGDLDMLSGSAQGGAFLFVNNGSKTSPDFSAVVTLLESAGHGGMMMAGGPRFGDAHIDCPAGGTRVWADDVDGDGKLDLLVGDQLTLQHVVDGVSEKEALEKLTAWNAKEAKLFESMQSDDPKVQESFNEKYQKLEKEKKQFVTDEVTGFVWLLRQK